MMAPPAHAHAQAGLVSSSGAQYGAPEQTHAMYGKKVNFEPWAFLSLHMNVATTLIDRIHPFLSSLNI